MCVHALTRDNTIIKTKLNLSIPSPIYYSIITRKKYIYHFERTFFYDRLII